jgi:hypothetical protein
MNSAHLGLEKPQHAGRFATAMPLLKLNRINKGGEILLNSDRIMFIEIESKATTVHMSDRQLFSVEDSPDVIAEKIEASHVARIANAIRQSGLSDKGR